MGDTSQPPTSYTEDQPVGLPKPTSQSTLIGRAEREAAMTRLDTALHEHRIDFQEYDTARDLVVVARTQADIRSAMKGIDKWPVPNPRIQATAKDAKVKAVSVAKEGGRRLTKSLIRFVLACCLAAASLVLFLTDHQNMAIVVVLTSIAVYFTSVLALFVKSGKT